MDPQGKMKEKLIKATWWRTTEAEISHMWHSWQHERRREFVSGLQDAIERYRQ